jgi:hypothetical protein
LSPISAKSLRLRASHGMTGLTYRTDYRHVVPASLMSPNGSLASLKGNP